MTSAKSQLAIIHGLQDIIHGMRAIIHGFQAIIFLYKKTILSASLQVIYIHYHVHLMTSAKP